MEGEKILQNILKRESRQLQYLKNYTAPCEKILGGDVLKYIGKKPAEYEKLCKYGVFSMTLLRYCIEALSKDEKQPNGDQIQEDCFKCAILGADIISKMVTSGVTLPSEISISGIIRLFYHLIVNALKMNSYNNLLPLTRSFVNITRTSMKAGQDNIAKDSTSLCKQISGHLWNAAIKLSKDMDKEQRALLALSLRESSIHLLAVARLDVCIMIERGLVAGKHFQNDISGSFERHEGHALLFGLLSKAVTLVDGNLEENVNLYCKLEDLCITCCKLTVAPSHVHELLRSFNRLVRKDTRNNGNSQSRLSSFQSIIQILFCGLCFRLKHEKELENHQYDLDLKWSAIQKRLCSTSKVLRELDPNLYTESQILLAINYLRFIFRKILSPTEKTSENLLKIPTEVLSSFYDFLLVCYNIQSHVIKSKMTFDEYISCCNTWEIIVQPKLAMLFLISTVLLKILETEVAKTSQNSRKIPTRCDYVSMMVEGMKMLDGVVRDVPAALEQCIHYSYYVFHIGSLLLHNSGHINEATSLARLSCEAAVKWYHTKSNDTKAIAKVALYWKYELLSDCLAEQGHWLESVRTMSLCCQYHILCVDDCTVKCDAKTSEYVLKWSDRKHKAIKRLTGKKNVLKVQKCNLDDECKDLKGPSLDEEQICTLLKMELDSYRETGYCTCDQLCVVEKLFVIYSGRQDETNATLMRLEKVKVMYYMMGQSDDASSTASDGLRICEDLIRDINEMLHEQSETIVLKDIMASVYFWRFILQYFQAVEQKKDDIKESSSESNDEEQSTTSYSTPQVGKVNSLNNLWSDFLLSLHSAVSVWTDLVTDLAKTDKKLDVCSQSETMWMLQIASSVYGFLNMPLLRVHTLLVLATFASHCGGNENSQTVIVANSLAIQTLCEEGNIPAAELLQNECEEIIACLGEECQAVNKYVFFIAKSQLSLCKGLFEEGWELVKTVLDEAKEHTGTTAKFVLVKAMLLCTRYLSLPTSVCKASLEGSDCSNYFDYLSESTKNAEVLVKYFLANEAGIEFAGLNLQKKDRAVFLSHWSLLTELCWCYVELGKVYLLQGAVREAKRFLKDGREITRRFLSANRFSMFSLQLAELNVVLESAEECKTYLEDAMTVLNPDLSLSDIIDQQKPMELNQSKETCPFSNYQHISSAQLQVSLVNCYYQYLKLSGTIFDVRKVISLLHDRRKCAITQYEQTLNSLERMLVVKFKSKYGQENDEATLCTTGKRKIQAKSKGEKNATKRDVKETCSHLIPGKDDIASLVFLESCLKTHSLDGDDALKEGDYPRLLSNVRAGLDMVQWAQGIVNDPFLLDMTSSSLLHYLQGVAHMLASKDGFDSWRVTESHLPSQDKEVDVADTSEIMSKLSLSLIIEKPTVRKSRRGGKNGERELCNDSSHEDFPNVDATPVENKTRKRGRPAQKLTVESSSRSKRKPATRKVVNSIPHTPLALQTQEDCVDIQTEEVLLSTKKGSRSCRKNVKDSKSASKPRRNAKRNILCDDEDFERPTIEGKEKGKGMSCDFVEQCIQNEETFDACNGMKDIDDEDKDMKNALDSFNSSLTSLHPCYNPVLLTRICHAFVLCYGLKNPEKATVYQNMAMATTLRHQTMNRSSNKIRKEKGRQVQHGKEDQDELLKPLDSKIVDKGHSVNQMLHLQIIKNAVGFETSAGDVLESLKSTMDLLPEDFTVCTLSIVQAPDRENVKHLVITRLRRNNQSLVLRLTLPNEEDEEDCMEQEFQTKDSVVRDLSSIFRRNILSDFAGIMRDLRESHKIKSRRDWLSRRGQIDNQIKRFVERMEETWFGGWRGILNGRRMNEVDRSRLRSYVEKIQEMAVEILGRRIQNEQLLEVFTDSFYRLQPNEILKSLAKLTGIPANCKQLIKFSKALSNFLDDNESVDNAIAVKRGPVVLILDKTIQHLPFEAMPILRDQEVSRMPSIHFIKAHLNLQRIKMSKVDTRQTFYILNPQDNLPQTEKRFSDWFSSEKGWKGVVGRPPSAKEFKDALANHQLFIYMGHGNGREFLNGDEITRLYCQAVALIMGCSSGKLIVEGQCEARGMALNYLLSGSPAVVGALWDVTDVDIDKFTTNMLRLWCDETLSLTQCMVKSRQVCNMKYANGAAPVVYGMPVYTRTVK